MPPKITLIPTACMQTRATNKNSRPGLVDLSPSMHEARAATAKKTDMPTADDPAIRAAAEEAHALQRVVELEESFSIVVFTTITFNTGSYYTSLCVISTVSLLSLSTALVFTTITFNTGSYTLLRVISAVSLWSLSTALNGRFPYWLVYYNMFCPTVSSIIKSLFCCINSCEKLLSKLSNSFQSH